MQELRALPGEGRGAKGADSLGHRGKLVAAAGGSTDLLKGRSSGVLEAFWGRFETENGE